MKYSQLQEWLKLPPGPWPPKDRELLGLPAEGEFDATAVELKALERMDMLRPHQLRHADLVTEGMNRLAQAMIALTASSPAVPVAPKKHRKHDREQTPLEIRKPDGEVKLDFGDAPVPATNVVLPSTPTAAPILEAEVIGVAASTYDVIPESYAVQTADEPADLTLDEPIVIPEPPPGTVIAPSKRRQGYREKVRIRQLRTAWSKFRSLLGDPRERLATPAKIASYLEAIASLRTALKKNGDGMVTFPDHAGELVLSVVCHPLPLSLLRDLVLSQRRTLARDWAVADADLEAKAKRLSRAMKRNPSTKPFKQFIRHTGSAMRSNPEWILVLLITLAIVIGFLRT